MAQKTFKCPSCGFRIGVPFIEAGMVVTCPQCNTTTRITRDMAEVLATRGPSDRMPAIGPGAGAVPPPGTFSAGDEGTTFGGPPPKDSERVEPLNPPAPGTELPPAPDRDPASLESTDADELLETDPNMKPVPPHLLEEQEVRDAEPADDGAPALGQGGLAAPGGGPADLPKLPDVPAVGDPDAIARGPGTKRRSSRRSKRRGKTADFTQFRSRIIHDYRHEQLAKLAVDVGTAGRTRGYIAAVILLLAAFLPVAVQIQESKLGFPPGFKKWMPWEFQDPPVLADFPGAEPEKLFVTWDPQPVHWLYVAGLPALGILTMLVAARARYRRRALYYTLLGLGSMAVMLFNPFTTSDTSLSPIGMYDPWGRPLDMLLLALIGIQSGNMIVLRYFHEDSIARTLTLATSVLIAAVATSLAMQTYGALDGATHFSYLWTDWRAVTIVLGIIAGGMVIFPVLLIMSPSQVTQALTWFIVFVALVIVLPLSVVLGQGGNADVLTSFRHFFGMVGAMFLLGIGVAETLNNKLLMRKVANELGSVEEWWSPHFQKIRLQARFDAKQIDEVEFRRLYDKIVQLEIHDRRASRKLATERMQLPTGIQTPPGP